MRTAPSKNPKNTQKPHHNNSIPTQSFHNPKGSIISQYKNASELSNGEHRQPKLNKNDQLQSPISIKSTRNEGSPQRSQRVHKNSRVSNQKRKESMKKKAGSGKNSVSKQKKEQTERSPEKYGDKLIAGDSNSPKNEGSKKYITQNKIQQLSHQQRTLLKELYQTKCTNLSIPASKTKFNHFLLLYIQANQSLENAEINEPKQDFDLRLKSQLKIVQSQSIETKQPIKALQLAELNPVRCEEQVNKLITSHNATSLNLSQTLINPSILLLDRLTHLYLNNCNLHNSQLQELFSLLQSNNTIQLLSLSSLSTAHKNHLTRYEKLYSFLENTSSLKQLQMANCSIQKENQIFQHLKNSSLTVIDLSHNEKVMGISSGLECLNLEGNQITNPSGLFTNECKNKNELRDLNVSSNPIPHYQLKLFLRPNYLAKLKSLTMNNLTINEDCPALQQFIISSNSLHGLSLRNCQLSQFSWMNLIHGFKSNSSLRHLNVSKNPIPNVQIAKALGQVFIGSHLNMIDLSQCSIEDQFGLSMFSHLHRNKHMQRMDLSRNKLGSKSGMTLSQVLKSNRTLMELNVEDNCISYLISKELKEYISRNKYLQTKNLSSQFNSLSAICSSERSKKEELIRLQEMLIEVRRERLMMEEQKYLIEVNELNLKISELKKQIKASLIEENQMIAQIEQLYAENESQSMTNSISQTLT